ncbi:MAG: peptide ABC transporter substrate-binding protein [Oligoflexia bacterium]|nr:peptide ABC transporter substrate-binding protein [Oligoflexia bacterium]
MRDRLLRVAAFTLGLLLAGAQGAFAAKNVLTYALSTEPPQLNSTKATDTESFFILGHIMEGLTRNGRDGETLPGVAEKWEISDRGATFHLRANARWSDGKPVTARDFVFAWRTAVDPKNASEYAFILYPVRNAEKINKGQLPVTELGVTAVDERTLKVVFEKPCGYFLGLTSFGTFMPVREDVYKAKGERYAAEAADLVSNGPFKLTSWVHGASLRMDRNPHYWNSAQISLEAIDIPYITPDNSARFNFFKAGKVDILAGLGKDDLPKAQSERMKMRNFSDGTLLFLEFNFREGRVTRNKKLRQAIAAVFNPQEYISRVVGIPGTKPGRGLIPAWLRGKKDLFRKEYPIADRRPDLARARALVAEARKELGVAQLPPLVWLTGDTPTAAKEAEYFQSVFKNALGIDLRIDKQIFKQRLAKMSTGDFDIVAAGWGPDYADPMTFAELFTSWNENNRGKYVSAEYDRLIRAAQATSDAGARMDAMAQAERLALEDVALLPTYERAVVFVMNDSLDGVIRHAVGPDPDFTRARFVSNGR